MSLGDARTIEEALEEVLEEQSIRGTFYVRVVNGEVQVYERIEDLPEVNNNGGVL